MKTIIGLTGSIATGKTTVSNIFKDSGYQVICSDTISHDLTSIGNKGYLKIVKEFGTEYLLDDKALNRKKLAALIFNDKEAKQKLEHILHPLVKKEIKKQIKESSNDIIFIDVPLLYEANFDKLCDCVIVVYCTKDTELERLLLRDNISVNEALLRIESQMSIEDKKALADYVIDNNGDKRNTYENTFKVLDELREDING